MADLLGHRKNSSPYQLAAANPIHSTSNGRLAPNFLVHPPDSNRGSFMMDCLSPNGRHNAANGGEECSPVLGHKTAPNSCAIHGGNPRLLSSKVSIACQTVTPPSPGMPVHLTPPAGFDVDDECISPSSDNCDSPMTSWRGTAVDLHHHVHHIQPSHSKKASNNPQVINPEDKKTFIFNLFFCAAAMDAMHQPKPFSPSSSSSRSPNAANNTDPQSHRGQFFVGTTTARLAASDCSSSTLPSSTVSMCDLPA